MKAIDSLLGILVKQGGTELRLAAEQRPQMFKAEIELPLTIPPMSGEQVRTLLDDLWRSHEAAIRERGQVSFAYENSELGRFLVNLSAPEPSMPAASFRRAGAGGQGEKRTDESQVGTPVTTSATASGRTRALPPSIVAILKRAIVRGASDVHLSAEGTPVARINGSLHALDGVGEIESSAWLDEEELRQVRGGASIDRAFDVAGVGRVRVNVYASTQGVCAALRILQREAPSLAELNLPAQLESLVDLPHGLVIACGPTGSGKSTTLAALVQHALMARAQVLVTLEDPIEYIIRPGRASGLVRQREVGAHVRDFATGLRDALREDPDMLLVGEMRDPETINLALTAAETGHLVFASLHSRTAPSAIERIVDTYPPERQRQIRVQLADSLRAVISQRLIPTADGNGRVAAVEVLRVSHGVANLIREGRTAQILNALQAGANEGMLVLERSLAELVRGGRIRREAAVSVANDPSMLADYLRPGSA